MQGLPSPSTAGGTLLSMQPKHAQQVWVRFKQDPGKATIEYRTGTVAISQSKDRVKLLVQYYRL